MLNSYREKLKNVGTTEEELKKNLAECETVRARLEAAAQGRQRRSRRTICTACNCSRKHSRHKLPMPRANVAALEQDCDKFKKASEQTQARLSRELEEAEVVRAAAIKSTDDCARQRVKETQKCREDLEAAKRVLQDEYAAAKQRLDESNENLAQQLKSEQAKQGTCTENVAQKEVEIAQLQEAKTALEEQKTELEYEKAAAEELTSCVHSQNPGSAEREDRRVGCTQGRARKRVQRENGQCSCKCATRT